MGVFVDGTVTRERQCLNDHEVWESRQVGARKACQKVAIRGKAVRARIWEGPGRKGKRDRYELC